MNYQNKKRKQKKQGSDYVGLIGGFCCIAFFLIIWLIVLDESVTDMNIYRNGNQTVGTIHRIRSSGRGNRLNVYIRYTTSNSNIERIQRVSIRSASVSGLSLRVGTNVHIRYHPDNPNAIQYGTAQMIINDIIFDSLFTGIIVILGIIGMYYYYIKARKQ